MDYKKYILPIDESIGTGILIGNLLITAGHVFVGCESPYVFISGEKHYLTDKNKIYEDANSLKKSDGFDLAIYYIENIYSPLVLDTNVPSKDSVLITCRCKNVDCSTPCSGSGIFAASFQRDIAYECVKGKVIDIVDNYFECQLESPVLKGWSGSPIFNGEKLIGILIGDKDGKICSNKVLFLSAAAIFNKLTKISQVLEHLHKLTSDKKGLGVCSTHNS